MHYHVTYKVSSVPSAIRAKHYQQFSVCLIFASKIITLCNYVNQFSLSFFLDFSHRRPPPVSDHFVVHQGWSLTRKLTEFTFSRLSKIEVVQNVKNVTLVPFCKTECIDYKRCAAINSPGKPAVGWSERIEVGSDIKRLKSEVKSSHQMIVKVVWPN